MVFEELVHFSYVGNLWREKLSAEFLYYLCNGYRTWRDLASFLILAMFVLSPFIFLNLARVFQFCWFSQRNNSLFHFIFSILFLFQFYWNRCFVISSRNLSSLRFLKAPCILITLFSSISFAFSQHPVILVVIIFASSIKYHLRT